MCEPTSLAIGLSATQTVLNAAAQNQASGQFAQALNLGQTYDNEAVKEQLEEISGAAAQEQFETHVAALKARAEVEANASARNAVGISVQDLLSGIDVEAGRDVATIEANRRSRAKQVLRGARSRFAGRKAEVAGATRVGPASVGLQVASNALTITERTRPKKE